MPLALPSAEFLMHRSANHVRRTIHELLLNSRRFRQFIASGFARTIDTMHHDFSRCALHELNCLSLMHRSANHVRRTIHELQLNSCRFRQFIASDFARTQHILDKYTVSLGGICHHNVRDSADELAVLDNRAARHECVQVGTTVFYKKFTTKYWLNFCRNSL